jgi:periplasmic protein TonB
MNKLINNWDELVFEYRHKDYGAYLLRFNYPFYLTISALIVLFIFVSGMVGPGLFKEKVASDSSKKVKVIDYTELKAAPPIEKIDLPKPAAAKYVAPKVVEEEVKEDEMLPTISEASAAVDEPILEEVPTQQEEVEEVIVVAPPPEPEPEPEPEPIPDVIKDPEFPGGNEALKKWLSKNLNYPAMASRMGIEGKVVVQFTVDEQGKISDATVIEPLHKLCDNEALRLVKSMPAWVPGEKNGVKTRQVYKLPIRFILQ